MMDDDSVAQQLKPHRKRVELLCGDHEHGGQLLRGRGGASEQLVIHDGLLAQPLVVDDMLDDASALAVTLGPSTHLRVSVNGA